MLHETGTTHLPLQLRNDQSEDRKRHLRSGLLIRYNLGSQVVGKYPGADPRGGLGGLQPPLSSPNYT